MASQSIWQLSSLYPFKSNDTLMYIEWRWASPYLKVMFIHQHCQFLRPSVVLSARSFPHTRRLTGSRLGEVQSLDFNLGYAWASVYKQANTSGVVGGERWVGKNRVLARRRLWVRYTLPFFESWNVISGIWMFNVKSLYPQLDNVLRESKGLTQPFQRVAKVVPLLFIRMIVAEDSSLC